MTIALRRGTDERVVDGERQELMTLTFLIWGRCPFGIWKK